MPGGSSVAIPCGREQLDGLKKTAQRRNKADTVEILLINGSEADAAFIRDSLREFLSQWPHVWKTVTNLKAATTWLKRTTRCGAILLELPLVDADGLTTLRRLNQQFPEVPVIVINGVADDSIGHDVVRIGAQDCLAKKDLSGPALLRAIRYAMERHRLRRELKRQVLEEVREELEASERALRDSEALYHSLVENLTQNIFRKDCEGRFTFCNTNFCLLVGRHRDNIIGKTDLDLFPSDLAAKYQGDDRRVIIGGEILEAEEEHQDKNGRRIVVKVVKTPVYDAEGVVVGMQGIFWDVTNERRTREDLQSSRERFALAMRGSTDGIWDWDLKKNEIYFSSRFKQLIGYGHDELEDKFSEWEKLLHPDDHARTLAAFQDHLRHGKPYNVEYRLLCKNGSYRWFRARGLAVRNELGRATRMAGSISDINARKEAEAELRARTDDLERSNRDLEQFAYIASHDLKEPLRMVSSYVQLLQRRYSDKLDADASDFIGFAVDGAKRMKMLIEGLLEFSRIGTQGKELTIVSAEKACRDALTNLELAIEDAQAGILQEALPMVLADEVQLVQLFQNIIGNALKFCQRQPEISVTVEHAPGEFWTFSISDNGIGIRPEHFERIFQIYQRLHSRTEYEGTGIGLAICRRIIERHGGKIWVESKLGKGSTFHFMLKAVPTTDEPPLD